MSASLFEESALQLPGMLGEVVKVDPVMGQHQHPAGAEGAGDVPRRLLHRPRGQII